MGGKLSGYLQKPQRPMFSDEQICYTNTKLDSIYDMHPPICVFSVSATKVLLVTTKITV